MDKGTLSNYGWIVIAVLVLSVMIALATPFGRYIETAVKSTTEGLFTTSQNAFNNMGLDVVISDQEFDDTNENINSGEVVETPTPIVGSATFNGYYDKDGNFFEETITLTWEELKPEENGIKYGYDASMINYREIYAFQGCSCLTSITIPDGITNIGAIAFCNCNNLENITIPDSITNIGTMAFCNCNNLESITFEGTKTQWNAINLDKNWNDGSFIKKVICNDGEITLPDLSDPF